MAALETGALAGRGWAGKPDALGEVIARALRHPGFAVVVAVSPCITYDMERITWDRLYEAWQPVPAGLIRPIAPRRWRSLGENHLSTGFFTRDSHEVV